MKLGREQLHGASLGPVLLVILAAVFWGIGNVIGKRAGKIDMLAFVVWAALAVPIPLILASLIFDGAAPLAALMRPSLTLILCVMLLAYGATVISYGLWARLLALYSAAEAAPFALLIPVVGMISGAIVFGEPLSAIELSGAALVMAGLTFNVFGDRLIGRREKAARDLARHQSDPRRSAAGFDAEARPARLATAQAAALKLRSTTSAARRSSNCRRRKSAAMRSRKRSARRWARRI